MTMSVRSDSFCARGAGGEIENGVGSVEIAGICNVEAFFKDKG